MFASLMIVPLVLMIFLPSIFLVMLRFAPADPDIENFWRFCPGDASGDLAAGSSRTDDEFHSAALLLMIPVMTASIMAASAFVGEKEKHTLETLLYCPCRSVRFFAPRLWRLSS